MGTEVQAYLVAPGACSFGAGGQEAAHAEWCHHPAVLGLRTGVRQVSPLSGSRSASRHPSLALLVWGCLGCNKLSCYPESRRQERLAL